MSKPLKVKVPAILERSGKVIDAPSRAYSHAELIKLAGLPARDAKHDFELTNGKIVNRIVAAKIAEQAHEVPKSTGEYLHSHDLRHAEGIKKKKL